MRLDAAWNLGDEAQPAIHLGFLTDDSFDHPVLLDESREIQQPDTLGIVDIYLHDDLTPDIRRFVMEAKRQGYQLRVSDARSYPYTELDVDLTVTE